MLHLSTKTRIRVAATVAVTEVVEVVVVRAPVVVVVAAEVKERMKDASLAAGLTWPEIALKVKEESNLRRRRRPPKIGGGRVSGGAWF